MNQLTRDFADACRMNTLPELDEALATGPDRTDLLNWSITEAEWTEAVTVARAEAVSA